MKKTNRFLLAFAAAVFVFAPFSVRGLDQAVRAGSFAAADMGDGYWCRGTVLSISDERADFESSDGRRIALPAEKLIPFSKSVVLEAGDAVLAVWGTDAILFPATVKKTNARGVLIEWSDGASPSVVAKDALVRRSDAGKTRFETVPRPEAKAAAAKVSASETPAVNAPASPASAPRPAPIPEAARVKVGAAAAGRFPDGRWYLGVVEGRSGDGFLFAARDGREAALPAEALLPLEGSPRIAAGDAVGAVWGREARFSAGTVLSVEAGGALIDWTEGMKPSFVENGRILAGVETFRRQRDEAADEARIRFRTTTTEYAAAPASGRIYVGTIYVGRFDASSGRIVASDAPFAGARVTEDGMVYSNKKAARAGKLERSGALFLGGNPVGAIGRDGWIYRGGSRWAALDAKAPAWNELRLIAAALILCSEDFGF